MIKNIKPRAPSFCPPTRVFTQPVTFNRNNMITCVASFRTRDFFKKSYVTKQLKWTSCRKDQGVKIRKKVQKSSFRYCRRLKGFLGGWKLSSGLLKSVPKSRVDYYVMYIKVKPELRGALEIVYGLDPSIPSGLKDKSRQITGTDALQKY